jgi:hypothetical protein
MSQKLQGEKDSHQQFSSHLSPISRFVDGFCTSSRSGFDKRCVENADDQSHVAAMAGLQIGVRWRLRYPARSKLHAYPSPSKDAH